MLRPWVGCCNARSHSNCLELHETITAYSFYFLYNWKTTAFSPKAPFHVYTDELLAFRVRAVSLLYAFHICIYSTELRFFDPLYVVVFFSSQSYLRCVYAKCFSATTANYRGWHATNTLNIECQWRGKRHVMAGRLLLIKIIRTEYWRRRRIVFFAGWCALNWIKSQKF